jgi:hypothetical protein
MKSVDEASSTGHHIRDLFRRHRMNQPKHKTMLDKIGTKMLVNNKIANKAIMCLTGSTDKTNTMPKRTVTINLKVKWAKTSNITKMLRPKTWEHLYIPLLSK